MATPNAVKFADWPLRYSAQKTPMAMPSMTASPAAPVDPYAFASGKRNVNEYADMIRRDAANSGVVQPMPDMQPVKIEGSTAIRNPFGGSLTQRGWEDLQNQMQLIHRPDARQQAKALEDGMMTQAVGGASRAPMPMKQIMNQTTPLVDDPMRMSPESVNPEYRARWEKDSKGIRGKFSDTMTRVGGINTLDKLLDVGDNLSKQYPNHPGFIRDMMESFISRQPSLKREYDTMKMEEMTQDQGNEVFQTLPPQEQAMVRMRIQSTTGENGIIPPDMVKELGLTPGDKAEMSGGLPGQYGLTSAAGKFIPMDAQTIGKRYAEQYGLGYDEAKQEIDAPTGDTGMMTTESGKVAFAGAAQPNITGTMKQGGKTIATTRDGKTITEDDAPTMIDVLRSRGKPGDIALAKELEGTFGITSAAQPQASAPTGTAAMETQPQQAVVQQVQKEATEKKPLFRIKNGYMWGYNAGDDTWFDLGKTPAQALKDDTEWIRTIGTLSGKAAAKVEEVVKKIASLAGRKLDETRERADKSWNEQQ